MNCADFIRSLYRGETFDDCARHYGSCPECRVKYKDDFRLELALKGLGNDCREFDLAASVKKAIKIKQRTRRELSIAKWFVWTFAGLVSLILGYLAIPMASNWFGKILAEPQPVGKPFGWLTLLINNAHYQLNNVRLSEADRGLIYLALIFLVIAILFLAIELKGFLVRLRVILNR
jgi:hypothetical protein